MGHAGQHKPSMRWIQLDVPGVITGKPTRTHHVVPAVGAGVGEMVLFASGSSARQTERTDRKPVDAVVMAIVDSWEIEGDERYRKGESDA